ncbi:MAG: potassium uptake protein [Bdellovibrionales bacterium]|nr:potassium uptake protein [Bdellovibrionales bacterium]
MVIRKIPTRQARLARKESSHPEHPGLIVTAIGALGVVYGDIGTSPLYAFKECFDPTHGLAPTPENILGILSLIFWSLVLVVVFKYLIFIVRADNKGEGGIMALLALLLAKAQATPGSPQAPSEVAQNSNHRTGYRAAMIILMGLIGASLLYGDGLITPAISVLSAVEGLKVATPGLQNVVVPITIFILFCLFSFQNFGTARIGLIFGPTMLLWFGTITAIAIPWLIQKPEVFAALSPHYAVQFFINNGTAGFLVLSAVVLCITGGEALYADMGHFGKNPIRLAWIAAVFPALVINYFGQGALVLAKGPEVLSNPFYGLVDGWMLYPLVGIATLATVIASQALISGAYSLTQQAVQLGYLPRLTIHHTSRATEGQIFVPRINQFLMIGCIALVIAFEESTHLAAAYGIAVTGTMITTSILFYFVLRYLWGWSRWVAFPLFLAFFVVDTAFFSANLVKIHHGGWVPLAIAYGMFTIMTTWKRGREILAQSMMEIAQPLDRFFTEVGRVKPPRVKGTAVFMTLTRNIAPSVLLHHFRHNQVLHEKVILLSIITRNDPEIDSLERVRVTELSEGFFKVIAWYGYMETPDISEILARCDQAGLKIEHDHLSFYLGRETFLTTGYSKMAQWRKRLFVLMSRNARTATEFFRIPPDKVIEIGSQIRI